MASGFVRLKFFGVVVTIGGCCPLVLPDMFCRSIPVTALSEDDITSNMVMEQHAAEIVGMACTPRAAAQPSRCAKVWAASSIDLPQLS